MTTTERLEQLIEKGHAVLRTHVPSPPNVIGVGTINSGQFTAWQTQTLSYLQSNLSSDNQYIKSFTANVKRSYKSDVNKGIGILSSLLEDINLGLLEDNSIEEFPNPINSLLTILERFHLVVRQLRNRYDSRSTLDVNDEYDVQNLLHSLLILHFDDIRAEEWTPSYAGKSSRMDFLLKDYKIIIEVKKTRPNLRAKEVGSQLIEDIARYKVHPDCETLICFVYDPEALVGNPRGLENDLSSDDNNLKVRVYIRP
ncbi:hypothetical protein BC749_11343 [Flavobacterium araucananum]|uniref:Malate dehydrogenase n=1 Tax=Flavobacterium araucananum TaxID=946678 RepID=A0A227NPI6_9FLAO|nr:hypothetical protein [Flavobacterium araucananum]OXE99723.1 hypothetical protein B0A64_21060 [Flavobacterium araucananum]PWJ95572.1 hypothetical protein BC749_11343 [Flavobacterium araucananum]